MANNDFDDQIRDALDGLNAKYEENSWESLMGRMMVDPDLSGDMEEVKEFDKAVKAKLEQVQPEHPSTASWDAMAERIKQEFSIRRRLLRYKVVEIGLVLLVILTLFNYFPGEVNGNFKTIKEKIVNKKRALANYKNTFLKKKKVNDLPATIDVQEIVDVSNDESAIALVIDENDTENNVEEPILTEKADSNPSQLAQSFSLPQKFQMAEIVAEAPERQFTPRNLITEVKSLGNDPLNEISFEEKKFKGKSLVAKIFSPIKELRVSMFTGIDYNYIETPFDDIFGIEQYGRFATGYQAGVTIGFKNKNIEVVTGGIYSRKDYQSRIPPQYFNNLAGPPIAIRFDKIQLNMLEVPLNFRYALLNKTRWRFYAQTGASLHVALRADYDRSKNSDFLFVAATTSNLTTPGIEQKEFNDGLLEGGNFKENSYITANLGVGVERCLLYTSPSPRDRTRSRMPSSA